MCSAGNGRRELIVVPLSRRMCFESMNTRAAIYDQIVHTKLEEELLVLKRKGARTISAAVVNAGVLGSPEGTPVSPSKAHRMSANAPAFSADEWQWLPVLAVVRGNSNTLQLHQLSAEYEDVREEYLHALSVHKAGGNNYSKVRARIACCVSCCVSGCAWGSQVQELKDACDAALTGCVRVEFPLPHNRTALTTPNMDKFPRAGPL